jgi:hypothetical protein
MMSRDKRNGALQLQVAHMKAVHALIDDQAFPEFTAIAVGTAWRASWVSRLPWSADDVTDLTGQTMAVHNALIAALCKVDHSYRSDRSKWKPSPFEAEGPKAKRGMDRIAEEGLTVHVNRSGVAGAGVGAAGAASAISVAARAEAEVNEAVKIKRAKIAALKERLAEATDEKRQRKVQRKIVKAEKELDALLGISSSDDSDDG